MTTESNYNLLIQSLDESALKEIMDGKKGTIIEEWLDSILVLQK